MNIEKRLYLALQAMVSAANSCDRFSPQAILDAETAMEEFESSLGPLPEWAVSHNIDNKLVPGLQLFTLNGRAHGNAHIIYKHVKEIPANAKPHNPYGETILYELITDAGNILRDRTEEEVLEGWELGLFISPVDGILKRFQRYESHE